MRFLSEATREAIGPLLGVFFLRVKRNDFAGRLTTHAKDTIPTVLSKLERT